VHIFNAEQGNEDTKLLEKLIAPEELSGLLNKALEGLFRLLEKGKFSNDRGVNYTEEMWTRNDTVGIFVKDCIEENSNSIIPKQKIYDAYLQFCKDKGFSGFEDNAVFGRKINNYLHIMPVQKTIDNCRIWCYQGICLKQPQQISIYDNHDSNEYP
jgi:putative DNA primase/helicase